MGKNNIIDIKINLLIFIKLLIFSLLNNHIKASCPLERPVMNREGSCLAIPCFESQIHSGECKISNNIIKIQWLNKIIVFAENGYQFVSAATFSNGNLILEAIKSNSDARFFYGLSKNGNIFIENSKLNVDNNNGDNTDPYFNLFTAITENNNEKKEFLVFVLNKKNKIELYDLDNSIAYTQEISSFGNYNSNYKYMSFKIKDNDNDNIYTIFATTINNNFFLSKLNVVYSNTNEPIVQIVARSNSFAQTGKMISCFETTQNIICFYQGDTNYRIIAFNYNLVKEQISDLLPSTSTNKFFKCIHVRGNIGGFLVFSNNFPNIFLKEYNNGNFEDLNDVILDYKHKDDQFKDAFEYNDFIKISDNKISFVGFMDEIGYLFVVLLELIGPNNDIVIRYYSMDLKNLYILEIVKDLRAHNYNNYISLIFNSKNPEGTNGDENNNINFLIFSYPNITDNIIDLEEYIVSHDNLNVYKFEANLKEFILIDNNIFGYVLSDIKILSIEGCEMFDITLQPKNEPLNPNYILEEDEIIKLILMDKYKPFNCQIKYTVSATELDYEKSKEFPIHEEIKTNDIFNEESYNQQRDIYQGKIGIYSIKLIYNLSHVCEDNCKLCSIFANITMANCLICKYDSEILGAKEKMCFGKNESKSINEIINNLDEMMKNADPEQSYIISGAGYTVLIKDIDEYIEDSTVNIDFIKCEQKLKANLPENTKLRMLQLNLEKEGEDSFTDQVEYRIYDENGNPIDLTACNDVEINIEYEITDLSKLDLDLISKFKDLGVDVFNIKDEFFNDICRPKVNANM